MATINYGLPTFDGDQAGQPIQFKSTITQGFQKIDQVMKQNEEAAAPVSAIETEIGAIQTMITALSSRLESAVGAINRLVSLQDVQNVSFIADYTNANIVVNMIGTSIDGYMLGIYMKEAGDSNITEGTQLFHCAGNPFNYPTNVPFKVALQPFNSINDSADFTIIVSHYVYMEVLFDGTSTIVRTGNNFPTYKNYRFSISGHIILPKYIPALSQSTP